jgi:hypothetical protein
VKRLLPLLCLVSLLALPAQAQAFGQTPRGNWAGETSNILLGPARLWFKIVEPEPGDERLIDWQCGCGAGGPWRVDDFHSKTMRVISRPLTGLGLVQFDGYLTEPTRFTGRAVGWVDTGGGLLHWTWWADWVPELSAGESDAEALAQEAEAAGAMVAELGGDDTLPPATESRFAALEIPVQALSHRIRRDAEQTAAAEGLPRPAAAGAPAGTSAAERTKVRRLARDAERAGAKIARKARALRAELRRIAIRIASRPARARHIRALGAKIADHIAAVRRELR